MNRKKMIELIVYILIVIVGIVLLMTNHLKDKEKINDLVKNKEYVFKNKGRENKTEIAK